MSWPEAHGGTVAWTLNIGQGSPWVTDLTSFLCPQSPWNNTSCTWNWMQRIATQLDGSPSHWPALTSHYTLEVSQVTLVLAPWVISWAAVGWMVERVRPFAPTHGKTQLQATGTLYSPGHITAAASVPSLSCRSPSYGAALPYKPDSSKESGKGLRNGSLLSRCLALLVSY